MASREDAVKRRIMSVALIFACSGLVVGMMIVSAPSGLAAGQAAAAPKTFRGLEMSVGGVERGSSAGLSDCPPGANTVKAMARPGQEYAIVQLDVKVTPGFKPIPLKKVMLTDAAGKTYNTAVSFVDVGKVPEFSCKFPFAIAQGTKLAKFQVEDVSFDISGMGGMEMKN
jgi:hypothetical protein